MKKNRFMNKYILVLLFCVLGLVSCGDKNKIPTNEIHYTTLDNGGMPLENLLNFGEGRIVSNCYVQDRNLCILKFDKDVKEIGTEAFKECKSLTSITIPPSVQKIDFCAFILCSSLTNVFIPSSVTEIGEGTFSSCSSLTTISIPPSVTVIGHSAFYGCTNLASISIPPLVTKIQEGTFYGCSNLTSISIPKGCKVDKYAFEGCPENLVITRY